MRLKIRVRKRVRAWVKVRVRVRVKATVRAMRDSVFQGLKQKQISKKSNNKIIISHGARRI